MAIFAESHFYLGKNADFHFGAFVRTAESLCGSKSKLCVFRCVASAAHFFVWRNYSEEAYGKYVVDDNYHQYIH